MSEHISDVIREKTRWHRALTREERELSFRGWHSRGYLPHFDFPGVRQFITWRLGDALPANLRDEWAPLLSIVNSLARRVAIEEYLDRGCGACHLRDERIAAIVEESLCHGDGTNYRLLAWCVMPNHVHAVIETTETPLDQVMHGWKSYTAKRANEILGTAGKFWQRDYFDRYVRNEEHFWKAVRYIENNPVKAGLVRSAEDWPWSSARLGARTARPLEQ